MADVIMKMRRNKTKSTFNVRKWY